LFCFQVVRYKYSIASHDLRGREDPSSRRVVFPVEVPPAMSEGEATNDDVFASLDQIFVDNAEIDAAFPSSESPERHAEQGTLYATAAPVRTTAAGLPHPLAAATAVAASGAAAFASAMMMDDLSSPAAAEDALESSAPVSAVASPTLAWSGGHVPWSTAAADDGAPLNSGATDPAFEPAAVPSSDLAADDVPPPHPSWLGARRVRALVEEDVEAGTRQRTGAIPRSSSVNWLWNATSASQEGKYESPATTPRDAAVSPRQLRTLNLGEDDGGGASSPVDFLFRGALSALKRAKRAAQSESQRISSFFPTERGGRSGADSARAALAAARRASVNGAQAVRAGAMRGAAAVTKWSTSAKYLPLRLTGKTRARIASFAAALIVLILVLCVIAWTGRDPSSSDGAIARALSEKLMVTSRGLTTSKGLTKEGQVHLAPSGIDSAGAATRPSLLPVVHSGEDGAAAASPAVGDAASTLPREGVAEPARSERSSAWLASLRPALPRRHAVVHATGGELKLQLRERLRAKVVAKYEVDSALARHDGVLRAERGAEATDEASRRGADAGANAALLRAALHEEGREQKAESEMTQEVEEDRATPAKPAPKEPVLTARDAEVPPALASDIGED
jgi:hypothetical protein